MDRYIGITSTLELQATSEYGSTVVETEDRSNEDGLIYRYGKLGSISRISTSLSLKDRPPGMEPDPNVFSW
jgi:hypothetical protein